ncbi:hypothetical protein ACTFIR_012883 [Dictyostelium discoideum]
MNNIKKYKRVDKFFPWYRKVPNTYIGPNKLLFKVNKSKKAIHVDDLYNQYPYSLCNLTDKGQKNQKYFEHQDSELINYIKQRDIRNKKWEILRNKELKLKRYNKKIEKLRVILYRKAIAESRIEDMQEITSDFIIQNKGKCSQSDLLNTVKEKIEEVPQIQILSNIQEKINNAASRQLKQLKTKIKLTAQPAAVTIQKYLVNENPGLQIFERFVTNKLKSYKKEEKYLERLGELFGEYREGYLIPGRYTKGHYDNGLYIRGYYRERRYVKGYFINDFKKLQKKKKRSNSNYNRFNYNKTKCARKKVFITPKKELFNVMERSMKKQSVGRSALLNVKKKKYRAVVTTNVSKSVRNTVLNVVYNNNWLQYLKKQKNKINKQLRVGNISNIQERKKVQQLSRIIKASTLKLSTLMIREGSSVTTVKETVKENIKKGRQRRLLQLRQTKENKKLNEVIKNFELKEIALNKTYTTNISTLEINWINNLQSIINHISKIQNNTALERLYELLVKNKRSVSTVIDILNEKLNIKGNKESKVSLLKLKGAWNSIAINYRWGYLLLLKGQRQLRIKQLAKEKLLKIQKNQRYKVIKRHRNKFQKNRNKFQRNTRNKFQRNRNKFQRNRNKFQRNRNKFQRNRNKFQRNRNKFQRNIRNKFQRNIRNKFQRNIRNNFGRNKFQKIIEKKRNRRRKSGTRLRRAKFKKLGKVPYFIRPRIIKKRGVQVFMKHCSSITAEYVLRRLRERLVSTITGNSMAQQQSNESRGIIGNSNMNVYIDFAQDNLKKMKIPNRQKFTKNHKRNLITKESRKTGLVLGNYGIKATETGYLKMKQMERIKGDLVKKLKDNMDIYFNFYPLFGLTNKGTARMGAGKGEVSEWYVLVKKEV